MFHEGTGAKNERHSKDEFWVCNTTGLTQQRANVCKSLLVTLISKNHVPLTTAYNIVDPTKKQSNVATMSDESVCWGDFNPLDRCSLDDLLDQSDADCRSLVGPPTDHVSDEEFGFEIGSVDTCVDEAATVEKHGRMVAALRDLFVFLKGFSLLLNTMTAADMVTAILRFMQDNPANFRILPGRGGSNCKNIYKKMGNKICFRLIASYAPHYGKAANNSEKYIIACEVMELLKQLQMKFVEPIKQGVFDETYMSEEVVYKRVTQSLRDQVSKANKNGSVMVGM